ncbi:phage tail spike protein [Streptococcus mitis]|uniref:phage tail spike protein n=1 Tax=Streptococcus mitis TaxID=28037 RepID=UPI002000CA19|nr:phage tail spike protein [Streptococcus mitis]
MIYLTNGNMPLNAAYADEIVQEENSTYQLTFRFPTSDSLWEQLKEETFLTADDLHGEQDFAIFEVEKKHGYIQVYANQVFTLLNNYVVNPISLDRQTGSTALSRFAGSITRDNPFSFFSDIEDRHTFNIGSKNAMEAFAKDKHSIIGQWGGDLVRHGYQVRLLKHGGSENESLFMYKKNLSSYQHKTSTKSLKTRITFTTTVKGEGEKAPDRTFTVTIDSPLINKYSQIYEDVLEVNDQDVKDEASLRKYGEQYYRTSLCDMMEDSLEIEVVGQSDMPVQMFDVVSIFHEHYNLDVRKKITKYTYSPMAKKLKSIGFGQFQSGLANAIGNAVSDAVKGEAQQLQSDFERQLARELKNADLAFDRQKEELVNQFTDGLNAAKAKAEEVKREMSDTIDQQFQAFDNGPLQEAKRKAEEALENAGTSSLLAQEAKRIALDSIALIAGKANQTDFQRVKETSKLYERIIGRSESDIADKVARMALTNQLFQVEVSKNENLKTVQSQLAGSWGVHNKNSVNEIIAGFNLAGRNAGIKAETIRLEGNTLADKLTAIDGYFKRLFVGEGTFATLNADIIRTNSITADKLVFNEALANRLVSNELITSKLVASRAFVNALNAITIDASQIVTGTLKGDRIYGGTIRGANIFGGTLTGHTKIQLGSYGSFDTVNGGLQINVPRNYNAKDGLGVQFIGSYGRGENVPYGLFVYKDSDFTVGNTATDTDEFIMTVGGYIKAKGIGWLKTGLGKVGSVSTGTLAFWKSTVAMDFAPNDIYYTYGGQAYGLWAIIKQNFSDKRLKENIVDCKHKALDYIQQFQFKEYDWKKQEDRPRQAHTKIGLIAQEVQAVDPTLVYENGDTLNLDNLRLTTIALKAIQELSQRIETLERKIA